MFSFEMYQRSADAIREKIGGFKPDVLLILGSGLGFLGDMCEDGVTVDYKDVPNLRVSTAPGHAGRFVFGRLGGRNVCVMQGRIHCYEGYSMAEAAYPVRVAYLLGARQLIITNAAGGVNRDFSVGDIMLIRDHIKLCKESPLAGENIGEFGARFNDMTEAYTPKLRETARLAAADKGISLREGTYMYFSGPQYETPAEIKAAAILGADTVGMSTVPEVITARHCSMEILGFSLVTNMAAGISGKLLSEREVLDAAETARTEFSSLVVECLRRMK
jgi:purine-nucleoside phosphorylase